MTAKQNLVSDIENRIGEYLTAKQTKQVVEDVNAAADNYVISAVATGEVNTELLKIFLKHKNIFILFESVSTFILSLIICPF